MNSDSAVLAARNASAPVWAMACVGAAGALLLALTARAVLNHQPFYDELLHVMAARGVLATGHAVIGAGEYPRGELYTRAVAVAFRLFGDSLASARLPALLAGMALVALIGAWVSRRAGMLAGICTAAILAVLPSSIEISVFARFYSMHALAVAVMAIAAFESYARRAQRRRLAGWAATGVLATGFALHFQPPLTVIAIGAIGCAVGALLVMDQGRELTALVRRRPLWWALGSLCVLAIIAVIGQRLGLFALSRDVPPWAAATAADHTYYNRVYLRELPLLWPLAPALAVAAAWRWPRLVLFAAVLAVAGLSVHSLAAWKASRYVFYLAPFLCIVLGCGVAAVVEFASAQLRLRHSIIWPAALLAMVAVNSQGGHRAVKLALGTVPTGEDSLYAGEPDWTPVVPELRRAAAGAQRIATSNAMKALYYLGRYDYEINASTVVETDTEVDFGRDPRTGRAVVGSAAAVRKILAEPGRTLVILEEQKLDKPYGVPRDAAALIREHCTLLTAAPEVVVRAWQCDAKGSG